MKKMMERLAQGATSLLALALALGLTSRGLGAALKLGEGITAYYDCETPTYSGDTVTVTGKSWDGSALTVPGNLSLQWNINNGATIGTPTVTKFGLCYSGGGTGGRCYQSSPCAGLLPGTTSGDWSFSFWMMGTLGNQFVNTPASGDNQGFRVTKNGSNQIVVTLSETNDGSTFNTVSITSSATYSFAGGTWHSIIVVRSNNVLTLYVDGASAGTAQMTAGSYLVNDSNTLTMADNSTGGIGQNNGSDEYCVWNRALSQGEVWVIAGGTAPISALANSEFPVAVSLESTGGFVTTLPQLAFKNATLSEITADTLKGRFGGDSISAKGKAATFFDFASSDSSTLTCEAQMDGDYDGNNEIFKSVFLTFTQNGDDVYVSANGVTKWMNKGSNPLGTSLANQGNTGSLATSISAGGYGIYNLRLPRTQETDATVVWNAGELLMPKIGTDGNKYVITLPASGMSVDANGNLKVASSGATTGATIDLPSEITKASILIKYSSLAAVSDKNVTLSTIKYPNEYVIGARTSANNALTLTGYYDAAADNSYPNNNASYGSGSVPTLPSGSGYFLFAHYPGDGTGNGTYSYAGYSPFTLSGGSNSQIRWKGRKIGQISIGGPISSQKVYAWPNVEIKSVALYVGSIKTASDVSDFTFTPTAEATIEDTGTYTLAGDNKLFDSIATDGEYVINVNESATLNIPAATTVNMITFNVAEGKTLTLTGSTLTATGGIKIVGEGKVSVSSATALSGTTIKGDGRIVYTGTLPADTLKTSFQDGNNWRGTVELKDYTETTDSHKIIVLTKYGNINSTVALNGVTSTMYAVKDSYPAVTLKEIEIGEGGWTDTDNEYGATMLYTAKLTGHGPITVKTRGSGTVKFIGDHTFDGSVTMGANTAKQVAFMKTANDTIPAVTAKAIVVAGGLDMSIASGNIWTASGGIKIDGSLTVLTSEKATATSGTISAYQDDAQIDETEGEGTTTYKSNPLVATLDNSSVEISDNQSSMGTVTVVGASSITGSGGACMKALAISDGATLTYDPVITPLRVKSAPVFNGTGKLKLASRYAGVTCGKFHLVSYPSSASVSGTLANVIDSSSFAPDVSYAVTEETVGSYHQLVLKVGDYDTNAKAVSIAQFGDSITEGIIRDGYRGTPNYRIPLMQLLEAYGYKPEARGYRKVGSTDANGVPADSAYEYHTGISAQRIYTGMTGDSLRAGFMESIEAHLEQVGVTDIITLKIGTNDSIGNETSDNMFDGWTNLVWKIVRMRPTSKIVVCAPIKIRSGEKNAPGLRTKIAEYVALTEAEGGFPTGQVTMINGFDIVTDDANYYLTDNVHPNWNGHMQLANAWLPAVTNAFESMKVNDVIVHAEDTYTPQPSVASAETVAELASYRAGYIKLATFTNVWTKLSTWSESPYKYVNDAYKDTPMGRVAYFVARKTTASPDTRYVWVDMDADETTGATLADFGVPTNATVNGVVKNLHICSNSSAIENVAPTVSGVKGTLMRTEKGINKADGISTTLAPTGPYGYDWNDTIGTGSWGAMNMARIFDGATPTNHRKLLAAQMLFEFNGFNGGRKNALGIGDFAVHGPYNYANDSVDHFNLNWTFSTAKDEMPTMDIRALETGVIEIWGKQVYMATIDSDANFGDVATSADLPVDASACDLVINVTADSTLTFGSAISVGSIRFNIAEDVTLTLGGTLNLSGAVVISGPGMLQLSSSGTFGRMDVASSAKLGFAGGVSLAITDSLWVASGSTLTLEPNAISTSSSTILSAASISGTVSVTLPEESGVDYSTIATETSYKIVRTPNVAFSYDGTIGATPTGWFTDVAEPFSSNLRVGPDSSKPIVYEVKDGEHPYNTAVTWSGKSATIALYADISQVANTGKPVLVGIGASGTDNKDFILLYRDADKVKLAVWNVGVYDSIATHMVGTAASVDVPSVGYHLYTATFNPDGALTLYCDSVAGTPGSAGRALDVLAGFQIGNLFKGVANGTWSRCSGEHGLTKGVGMAFAAIRGYDAVLGPDNVAKLAESFPAVSPLNPDWNITVDKANNAKFTACDATMTQGHTLQVHRGAFVIPEGNTLSVPILRTLNINSGSPTITATIDGTLDITGTSGKDVWSARGGANPGGIVFGEWNGSGTYTISSTGKILAPHSYLQTVKSAGSQTITVNGGVISAKGIWADTSKNNSSITLQNGGTLEVADIPSDGGAITKNFGYGTFRVKADATETRAINFSAASGYATTLDPFGNTLTLQSAALTGSGDITVNDSSDGHAGKVVFVGGSGYTGRLIMTDDNASNIDISGYTGTVLCQGTAAATIAKFDGFTGTVYFTGNVDATGVDLSGATVNIADNCTFTANAGEEGALVLGSGATVTLKVDDNTVKYDGYVPTVSGSGTVGYYNTTTSAAVSGADYVNGNNLLPYYNVWSASATASENTLSDNASARWKSDNGSSGVLPADNKNVAFKLENGQSVTLLVDATRTFNDIQVFGNGTLTIQQSGDNVLTVGKGLYTTANAGVQIDSGLAFAAGAKLDVESAMPIYVGINCGTAESPFAIPTITGSGLLIVAANKGLTTGSLTVGTLTVDGKLTLTGAGSVVTSASINSSGVVDVSAGTTLTVPTLTVNGTLTMGGKTISVTTISGTGRVEYNNNKLPDETSWTTGTVSTGWRGTVAFCQTANMTGPNLNNYGNAYSTVALTSVSGSNTYLPDDDVTTNVRIEGAVTINNGNPVDIASGWTQARVVKIASLEVNAALAFVKTGNTSWNNPYKGIYYAEVLKCGTGGSIDIGNQFGLRVDAVDFAEAPTGNACIVPITLTCGGDDKADGILYGPNGLAGEGIPVKVNGVANGQKLVHATINNVSGLYLPVTVTIPVVENATATVTVDGVAATGSSPYTVDVGSDVEITWTAASGYKITGGATQMINDIAENTTATAPTVAANSVTFSNFAVEYLADYSEAATITADVSGDDVASATYTLTVGETGYNGTYNSETGKVTFNNVGTLSLGDTLSYTISASGTTSGSSGSQTSTVGNVTPGWVQEDSTHTGNTGKGTWETPVTYTNDKATITDNTYTANTAGGWRRCTGCHQDSVRRVHSVLPGLRKGDFRRHCRLADDRCFGCGRYDVYGIADDQLHDSHLYCLRAGQRSRKRHAARWNLVSRDRCDKDFGCCLQGHRGVHVAQRQLRFGRYSGRCCVGR